MAGDITATVNCGRIIASAIRNVAVVLDRAVKLFATSGRTPAFAK
jgi:hypothetical protein